MRSWLEAEHQDKLSRPLDMSDWTMTYSDVSGSLSSWEDLKQC